MRQSNRRASLLAVGLLLGAAAAMAQPWRGNAGLEVRVSSRKGGALAGARVELIYRGAGDGPGPAAVATDAKGRAVLNGLAAGTWQIEVSHPDFMSYVAVLGLSPEAKPQITASFLEATGESTTPLQVKLLKSSGGPSSPPLQAAAPSPKPPTPAPEKPAPQKPALQTPAAQTPAAQTPTPEAPKAETPPAKKKDPAKTTAVAQAPEPIPPAPATPSPPQPEPPALAPDSPAAQPPAAEPPPPEEPLDSTEPTPPPSPDSLIAETPAPEAPPAPMPTPEPPAKMPETPRMPERPEPELRAKETPSPEPRNERPPQWRAYQERTCPECRPGEWAVTLAAKLTAEGGCGDPTRNAVAGALAGLADRSALELAAFAGSVDGAVALLEAGDAAPVQSAFGAADGGGCRILGVVLPKGSRFVGFQYEIEDAGGRRPCLPDRPCPGEKAAFAGPPRIARGVSSTVIHALAHATGGDGFAADALMTVFFRGPNDTWTPER